MNAHGPHRLRISRRNAIGGFGALAAAGLVAACSGDGGEGNGATQSSSASPGVSGVPDPVGALTTRWRADPFALGSYSYMAVGATPDHRRALAAPIGTQVFWAGEATDTGDPSTVHGAFESGRRAAEQVQEVARGTTLVIGAGIAGLNAAHDLAAVGEEVIVVEGRDRIGGRVWTDDRLGVPLDLGASWIHGVRDNPISIVADENDIERVVTDYDDVVMYDQAGDQPDAAPVDIYELASELRPDGQASQVSVAEAASGPIAEMPPAQQSAVEYALVTEVEQEFAADVEDLSMLAFFEGGSFGGGDVVFPNGYVQIAEALADGLDIRLGETVTTVAHDETGVAIETNGGAFEADRVVVTLPLGVLKAGAVSFDPGLPAEKVAAIEALGMGLLDKTFLEFPEVFWDDATIIANTADPLDEWASFFNLAPVTGRPILLAFHSGSAAERLELETDDQIVASAMQVLRRIYGDD